MRKLLTWIVVTIGIAALVRKLRRRGQTTDEGGAPESTDPADELRQKLASSRESGEEERGGGAAETFKPVEPPTPEPSSEPTIDERRADVHDEGRAAIDEMRKSVED
jgi:hypothetical protein